MVLAVVVLAAVLLAVGGWLLRQKEMKGNGIGSQPVMIQQMKARLWLWLRSRNADSSKPTASFKLQISNKADSIVATWICCELSVLYYHTYCGHRPSSLLHGLSPRREETLRYCSLLGIGDLRLFVNVAVVRLNPMAMRPFVASQQPTGSENLIATIFVQGERGDR